MTNDDCIKKAIELNKGKNLIIGKTFAHESDKMAYELTDIIGEIAILSYNGIVKTFPKNEIFDCNKVKEDAIKLKLEAKLNGALLN